MDCAPDQKELEAMRDGLIAYATRRKAYRWVNIITYLFNECIRMREDRRPIYGPAVCRHALGGVELSSASMNALMYRLSSAMRDYFTEDLQGIKHKCKAVFPGTGDYLPVFEKNEPKKLKLEDLRSPFWNPYFASRRNTHILYAEPLFWVDKKGTYIRNPKATMLNYQEKIGYLKAKAPLETSYSFVSAGVVQAMLYVITTLHFFDPERKNFPKGIPVKPWAKLPDSKENLIVLGTPTSTELVEVYQTEIPMSMRSHADCVTVLNDDGSYEEFHDRAWNGAAAIEMEKWGVLTRYSLSTKDKKDEPLLGNRIITLIAAKHGRTIEAIAKFITEEDTLPLLAVALNRSNQFPSGFQALFKVEITKRPDGSRTHTTTIEMATPFGDSEMPSQSN